MFDGIKTSGENETLWFKDYEAPDFPALSENTNTDVVVIGGGIAGVSIAYQLVTQGKSVILVEDGKIGSGETGRTSAHLASGIDDHYYILEKVFGEEGAKYAAESHAKAIDEIERISKLEKIKCDFERVDGYLFLHPEDSVETLEKELAAAGRAGFKKLELIDKPEIEGIKLKTSLKFPNQGQFHPLKYLGGLAKAFVKNGGQIFEKTHAREIQTGKNIKVFTNTGFHISAKFAVIATNSPVLDKAMLAMKEEPLRTYIICAKIPKNSVHKALYWDTGDPYHYVRVYDDGKHDTIIIGGEDHRVGEEHSPHEKFGNLKKWAKKHIPDLGEITYEWSGQVEEPADHLAFIGLNPTQEENVFVVSGDSGNGLTHGTIAGMLISDLILKKDNAWEEIYDPSRKPTKELKEFAAHNLKAASKYLKYLSPSDVDDVEKIKPDSGAVIRKGLKKVAVYKDKDGKLHECSAICPHMGGIVCWNEVEKSWDCPVHGSRFTGTGNVINGPAIKGLAKENK